MTDDFVHPRWTPQSLGGVASVIEEEVPGDRWTVSSDPTSGKMGWFIVGYTEVLIKVDNRSVASRVSIQYEGSLDRKHWENLPVYDRDLDSFLESDVLSAADSSYETLESDRWHYIRVKVRPFDVADADSFCSVAVAIGVATI